MASMYYSSESSDSDNVRDNKSLDLSYLMLDSDSLANYLRNSVREQYAERGHPPTDQDCGMTSNSPDSSAQNIEANDTLQQEDKKLKHKMETVSSEATGGVLGVSEYTEASAVPSSIDSIHIRTRQLSVSNSRNVSESDTETDGPMPQDDVTEKLYLNHNIIIHLPFEVVCFHKLKFLDLSNNNLFQINDFILQLPELQTLYVKNNQLDNDGIPKEIFALTKIREINLSGNRLTMVPPQLYEVTSLRYLYLGNNAITQIRPAVRALQSLQVLHLGGNQLTNVPEELGELTQLSALVLSNNRLRSLPRAISQLGKLRSLLLHTNNLCCLPVEIVKLRSLDELSLRDNPLVTRFVNSCAKELMYNPPSLKEMAARSIRHHRVPYTRQEVPGSLHHYLSSGTKCVNPKCKGVYFTSCVEHIKLVDFCGMYRVPLMHYLCSSRCSSQTPSRYFNRNNPANSDDSEDDRDTTMRRVLLG